jgi:hypothetical protein
MRPTSSTIWTRNWTPPHTETVSRRQFGGSTIRGMAMGKRERDRQPAMWVTTTYLPTAASHPFYRRLNQLLREYGFDEFAEGHSARFLRRDGRPARLAAGQVTGGKLIGSDSSVTDFAIDLSGDTLSGIVGGADVPHAVCEPCAPGFELSLDSRFTDFEGVTLNDVPYNVQGHFSFKADSITIPEMAPDSSAQLTVPFKFTGHLRGVGGRTLNLKGAGVVNVFLTNTSGEGINVTRVDYDFTSETSVP